MYNNVLERDSDPIGLAHYKGLLADGKTRGGLLLDFSESPENRNLFKDVTGLSWRFNDFIRQQREYEIRSY